MALKELDLFHGEVDKVAVAIARLKEFEPPEGYYLAFSGGKDSVCIKALADMAGVKYDAHYAVTGIDPPDLVYFVREHHPDVVFERQPHHMLTQVEKRGFPHRNARWCCAYLKENKGEGRTVVTGVRRAESAKRARWKAVEPCATEGKWYVHPIIDWLDEDVWEFIHGNEIPYCKLYDEGWTRIGCLFCPLARKSEKRICEEQYPGYVRAFKRAFERLYARRKAQGKQAIAKWDNADEMWEWYLYGEDEGEDNGTGSLFD